MDEKMIELIKSMSLDEVSQLTEFAYQRQRELKNKEINEAKKTLVEAWRKYRQVAPNDYKYVTIDVETNDGDMANADIDLYELIDLYL